MRSIGRFQASMRNRDERDMDRMRQGIPRGFNGATTTCNGENGPGRVHLD